MSKKSSEQHFGDVLHGGGGEDPKCTVSRRSFVSGLAALTAGGVFAGMTGCAPKVPMDDSKPAEELSSTGTQSGLPSIELSQLTPGDASEAADVVVLGSGGAGMAAAIQAAQEGLKVILLEKSGSTGGSSQCTEGVFGLNSKMQANEGYEYNIDQVLLDVMDFHHWRIDDALTRNYYELSGETIDWLQDLGIEFVMLMSLGGKYVDWHVHANGEKYMKSFAAAAESVGVDIRTGVSGKQLMMDDGKVSGIVADVGGEEVAIAAPVVVLATGGYSDSPELMEYFTGNNEAIPLGMGGREGDGVLLGLSAGGSLGPIMGTIMYFGGINKYDTFASTAYIGYVFEGVLWVNELGNRFVNEYFTMDCFSYLGNSILRQKKAYSIVPESYVETCMNEGCVIGSPARGIPGGSKLPDMKDQFEQLLSHEDGAWYAQTTEELAEKLGVPLENLQATIDQCNRDCDAGVDTLYGKDPSMLHKIEPPFYAFEITAGYYTTVDGLLVDTDSRVLTEGGEAVPGLYAAGSDAAGTQGDTYDVQIAAGSQQGWAVNSGRLAAMHAKGYIAG